MPANIIKARTSGESNQPVRIAKAVVEATAEAKQIVAEAHQQAEEMLTAAQAQCDSLFAEARECGYTEGLDRWNDLLVTAHKARDRYLSQNEAELVHLSVQVARKVVGDAAQIDSSLVLHAVRQAVRAARGEHKTKVRVRPQDELAVREYARALRQMNTDLGEIVILPDETIEEGGCLVESELGTIDARFSTQFLSLERALRGANAGDL